MGNNLNMKIDDGLLRLTFTNMEDEVFAKCKLNPADINIVKRCEEVSAFMIKRAEEFKNDHSLEAAINYNAEIEEKMSYLLGYDAKEDLFSALTATTILPNGSLFVEVVLDRIFDALKPEIEKRKKKMQASVNKYTNKYHK